MTPVRKQLSYTRRFTIFLSYGAILQSSFDTIIPIVLAFNASPPVSVLGTVNVTYLISGIEKHNGPVLVDHPLHLKTRGGCIILIDSNYRSLF